MAWFQRRVVPTEQELEAERKAAPKPVYEKMPPELNADNLPFDDEPTAATPATPAATKTPAVSPALATFTNWLATKDAKPVAMQPTVGLAMES